MQRSIMAIVGKGPSWCQPLNRRFPELLCACAHLIAALGTCPGHQAVRQELARCLAVQLQTLLLFQLSQLLQPIEDRLQQNCNTHYPTITKR